ncbi:MAG: hypothetical protein KDE31_25115, partial [Caldilineaceae bacterium]|nr:hypothetical protein [Caldilineaceae bacterium]
MNDSSMPLNSLPVDEWLDSISTLDNGAALALLQASALANSLTLETLAVVALDEVEQNAALAGKRLAVAALLRQSLVADSDEQGERVPAAVDAQLAYAQARLHVHQGQLSRAEESLRAAQAHWQRANDGDGLARS